MYKIIFNFIIDVDKPLWDCGGTAEMLAYVFKKRAIQAGYPKKTFAFHSLRSGKKNINNIK